MNKLLTFFALLSLTGCAATNELMVNPQTGMTQNCSAFGFGIIGVPVALGLQAECENNLKKAGYVTSSEFQKSGGKLPAQPTQPAVAQSDSVLKVESDPVGAVVYSGPDEKTVKTRIGTTPINLKNPTGSNMWARECFKATKDGYFDSEVSCFEPVVGNRQVTVKLTAK